MADDVLSDGLDTLNSPTRTYPDCPDKLLTRCQFEADECFQSEIRLRFASPTGIPRESGAVGHCLPEAGDVRLWDGCPSDAGGVFD